MQSSSSSGPEGASAQCGSCGKTFPVTEMIQYSGAWVCAGCKPVFFQRVRQGEHVGAALHYGGFWRRFAAKFIDGIALQVVMLPLQMALGSFDMKPGEPPTARLGTTVLVASIGLVLGVTYSTFFVGRFGATPGKMALGMKIVTPEGGPLTYLAAFGRYFAELLSSFTCGIGYIMAAFDDEHRALHDRVASTRVIITQK